VPSAAKRFVGCTIRVKGDCLGRQPKAQYNSKVSKCVETRNQGNSWAFSPGPLVRAGGAKNACALVTSPTHPRISPHQSFPTGVVFSGSLTWVRDQLRGLSLFWHVSLSLPFVYNQISKRWLCYGPA